MAQSATQNCEICMSARGSEYCLDCSQHFCANCKTSHLRMTVCKYHRFKNSTNASLDSSIFCQQHNEVYVFICESCELPVCRICIVKTHKGHEMVDITETVAKRKKIFQMFVRSTLDDECFQQLDGIEDKIRNYEKKLDGEVNSAVADIKQRGDILKSLVDNTIHTMIQKVQDNSYQEKISLTRSMTEANDVKKFRDSLRGKEVEIGTKPDDIGLLQEITELEGSIRKMRIPAAMVPPSIRYNKPEVTEEAVKNLLGELEFEKDHSSISTDDVHSGEVFEATLSHGTTFRNEISMLKDKVERLCVKDDEMVLIMFYKMQMMNTLCKSFVQKIIRVFMEISGKWKPFVLLSLEEVATSAPGLFFQITEDRQEADVILSDNKERPNLVCISWEKISGRYKAIIEFGHECRLTDMELQGVATLELLSAIGFHREMLRLYTTLASLPFSYENERSIIQRYDPYSILLNGSNKLMTHTLGRKTWSLEIGGYGQLCRLSELDKVGLNLLFPPCITKSFVPMLSSETKMFYCGRRVVEDHNRPRKSRTDGRCGPSNGANCPACRTLIEKTKGKMLRILAKGKFQGWSGEIYCGKKLFGSTCGPSYGSPCISCFSE